MLKKLDGYIIKTFIGPFVFIFSILFFIFLVQFAWAQLDKIAGKGLGWLTIGELLLYLGLNVIQLVLPLAILLGSIMTFGGFGERYELAAIKSTGISLRRTMMPLFVLVCFMSIGLYFFGDRVMPFTQEKAKTMIFNLIKNKPTLNFQEGVFIEGIPTFTINVDEISGEENELLNGIFIQRNGRFNEDLQTIRAQDGILSSDTLRKHYLKMKLFNGSILTEERSNQSKKKFQPDNIIQFDTLQMYFDISEIVETKQDTLGRHYKFLTSRELKNRIDSVTTIYDEFYQSLARRQKVGFITRMLGTEKIMSNPDSVKITPADVPWEYDSLTAKQQKNVIQAALSNIADHKTRFETQKKDLANRIKSMGSHKLHYQRNFSYAFTCIIFFLIGAPLGAIVKKGGIGMPVVMSIIIFVLYYIVNFSAESAAKSGSIDGFFAAWVANIIFFPIAVFLVIKSNQDSDLFSPSIYTENIGKIFKSLAKSNTYIAGGINFLEKLFPSDKQEEDEHQRYQ